MGVNIDVLRCTGCKLCQVVCSVANFRENNPKKAAIKIVSKLFTEEVRYDVIVCDQCGECIEVCPFDAISMVSGVVIIDPDICTNCGICVDMCPRGAMFTHPEVDHPIKCIMCGECTKYCPRGILDDLAPHDEEEVDE